MPRGISRDLKKFITGKVFYALLLLACLDLAAAPTLGQCAGPNFNAGVNVGVGVRPVDIASGDFNGDGKTDFAVANANSAFISVLLGSGTGIPTLVKAPVSTSHVAVADLNKDGKLDLIATTTTTSGDSLVAVMLGDGAGGFDAPSNFTVNTRDALAVADFNNDGNPDVLVGNSSTGTSQLLLGTGAGGFGSPSTVILPNTSFIRTADFNNDGKVDLAVGYGFVYILLGDGAGHFGAPQITSAPNVVDARVADFNGDGKLDLVTAGQTSSQTNAVSIMLGDGAGGFGSPQNFSITFTAVAVGVGDFDGDGKVDAVAAGDRFVSVLLGTGAGGLNAGTNYNVNGSPVGLAIGDTNGDGKLDAATINTSGSSLPPLNGDTPTNTASILLGDGAGHLRFASVINVVGSPFSVASGDLNGDGKADLAVANLNDSILIMLGDGVGGFGTPSSIPVGARPTSVTIGDLNGDGKLDLLTANFSAGTVSVFIGDGAGGFGSPTHLSVPGFGPEQAAIGDFNNDGKPDIVVTYLNASSVSILLGNGAGGFGSASNFNVPFGGEYVAVNDFNGDGKSDLAVGVIGGVSILLGNGNGGFGAANTLNTNSNISSIGIGDFNGDGKADLAAGAVNISTVSIALGDGQGGFSAPRTILVDFNPGSVVVADYNGDGASDFATANSAGTISVSLGDGAGSFASTTTYMTGGFVPRSIAAGDFNNDGRPDLVTANQGGNAAPGPTSAPTNLSVFINTCSAPPPATPSLSINNVSVTEGDAGTLNATFTVNLSAASSKTVAVSFYSVADDALKDVDYQTVSGRLSFAPGVTSQTLNVPLSGDTLDEFDEKFRIILAHPLNANIGDGQGLGTILDNDPPPSASINDVTLDEGNAGSKTATFTVSLSAPSGKPISIAFATADGAASAGTDYQETTGTLTFNPGQTTRTINVTVNGDTTVEPNETFFVNLTNPSNVTLADAQGAGAIVNDDTSVQFDAGTLTVNESAGIVQVTVTRAGLLSGTSTVNYSTSDATASERSDYNLALGTLTFAPNETSKTVNVFITDDALVENPETFNITLSGPTGSTLGAPSTTVVTINSDDATAGPNPIDDTAFFVRQHYRDFLNRDPDASGFAFWTHEIDQCGSNAQCRDVKRINVSAAFFLSIEFQETGYLVERIYKTAYGDTTSPNVAVSVPIIRLQEFLPDTQKIGQGVVVGVGAWQQQLESNKQAFALEFVQRQRFLTNYPLSMTPAQFVDQLNARAGSVLTQTERDQLIAQLAASSDVSAGRAQVLRAIAENPLFNQNEKNRAFVLMQYYGYMRRNPDDPRDTDFRGWKFWLDKLNEFNGNFIQAEMVKAFISSDEYRKRFGQ
jgi:hypothetical protein